MDTQKSNRIIVAFLAVVSLLGVVRIVAMLPPRASKIDFAVHYVSSRLLLETGNPYGVPLQPYFESYGFEYDPAIASATNPPPLMWFVAAFCFDDHQLSFTIWSLLQGASLLGVLGLTRLMLFPNQPIGWWLVVALTIISAPLVQHFYYGQVQLFLVLLVGGAFYFLKSGRSDSACALVAIAGILKLYPLILLPWFLASGEGGARRKAIRAGLVFGAVLAAFACCGSELWLGFRQHSLPIISNMTGGETQNFSIPALLFKLYWAAHDGSPPAGYRVGATLCGLVVIACSYVVCFCNRRSADPRPLEFEFSLLLLSMITGGMTAWYHYFVFLIFPLALLSKEAYLGCPAKKVAVGLCVFFIVTAWHPTLPQSWQTMSVLLFCTPTYAAMVALLLLSRQMLDPNALRASVSTLAAGKLRAGA